MVDVLVSFEDSEYVYGLIEIEENIVEKVETILETYRSEQECYNIDDFFTLLREKGIKFKVIRTKSDYNIHF